MQFSPCSVILLPAETPFRERPKPCNSCLDPNLSARTMGLHQATFEPMIAGWEFEAEAQRECLGFGFGASHMVPVVVGVVSSKHFVGWNGGEECRWMKKLLWTKISL